MKHARLISIFLLVSAGTLLACYAFKWTYSSETQTLRTGHKIVVEIRTNRFTGARQSRVGDSDWEDGVPIYD